MIDGIRGRMFHAFLTVWLLAVLAVLAAGAMAQTASGPGQADPTGGQNANSPDLARYYGFERMEILKYHWGVPAPVPADINGDGLTDLTLINNRKARIDILLQKKDFQPGKPAGPPDDSEDINDLFGREETWRLARVSVDLDVEAAGLVVADLNADKRPDLAVTSREGIYVFYQGEPDKPADSDHGPEPTWLPARRIEITGAMTAEGALAAGDLNGDGRTDLVLLAEDGTYLVFQKEDGVLAEPEKRPLSGERPREIAVADLQGDGRADLIVFVADPDFPLRVRFQTPAGKLGPETRLEMSLPRAMRVTRLGESAQAVIASISARNDRAQFWAFSPTPPKEVNQSLPVLAYPLPASAAADRRAYAAADLDGDGLTDVVVSDPARGELLLLRADPKTSLQSPQRFPALTDIRRIVSDGRIPGGAADPGDRPGVLAVLSVGEKIIALTHLDSAETGQQAADKPGRLVYPRSIDIQGEPLALAAGRLNDDDLRDLAYISRITDEGSESYHLHVLIAGEEPGRPSRVSSVKLSKLRDRPAGMHVADINGDGRGDVVIVPSYGSALLVLGATSGDYREVTDQNINAGLVSNIHAAGASIAPLGPDGRDALFLAQKNFARALVFEDGKGWVVVDQYQADDLQANLTAAAAYDSPDSDAPAIAAYDSGRGKLVLMHRRPDGTYGTAREVPVGQMQVEQIFAGEFGGSGPSLLLCGQQRLVRVPLADRPGVLRKVASFEPDIRDGMYGALAVGDVNADGLPDVVLAEQARHHVQILGFDDQGELTGAYKWRVFETPADSVDERYGETQTGGEPRAITLADVTGDGKTDIILTVHDRLIIYPQD